MRNSYKANRRQAERGRIATDFSPHIVGLAGAMEVRMRVSGLDPSPTDLWYEIVPFALIADPEVGVEAIAEYAVYVERTSDTKLGELRAALNLWIKKSRPEDKLVELLTKPICEQKRWWALIDEDTRQHIDSLRRALET